MDPIASAAAQSGLNCGLKVVKRHWGYLRNYKDKVEELNKNARDLEGGKERVQRQIKEAEVNAEEILSEPNNWLNDVNEEIKEYNAFLDDEGHAKTGCSTGCFPKNLLLRYQLGRKATKLAEGSKAKELVDKNFDRVSCRPAPSIDVALTNIGYQTFPSRQKTVEGIEKALKDPTIRMIGVYGAGGVGKSTLVKDIAKKAKEDKLFNMVVMANITRNHDIKNIQGQIAEMLGMRLEEESVFVRAGRLRKRLKNEKVNILIILDDLWDGLDLNIFGIPCGDDDEDDGSQRVIDLANVHNMTGKETPSGDYKGFKILLISRSKEVLCKYMNVKEDFAFPVGILEDKEAVTLLKKEAGITDENSRLEEIAIQIAKMCHGLPIAMVSIGRTLKNEDELMWEDVCGELKRHGFRQGQETVEFCIKLSYDHLKKEELKSIFLLYAIMGNDPLIMDLVKHCIGLDMFQGIDTINEARRRVHVLLKELKYSGLLVESYSNDRFSMHDIVRDIALSIASKEKHVVTIRNDKLDKRPLKDKLVSCTGISLQYCDIIDGLPESIHCPRLEFFHVDNNNANFKISDDFFEGMGELKVLILTGVDLSCFPSSIKNLKNLRMLCLERCTLGGNLSIIGELRNLRILTLSGSIIENLPIELEHLSKLQLFDISNCFKLRVIPSNVLSRLNNLEELYMRDNLIQWEAKQRNQSDNANLSELRNLNRLTTLEIQISSIAQFPQNLFFDKLGNYKIVIGEFNMIAMRDFKMPPKYEAVKLLALQLKDGSHIHSEEGIKMLFKSVEKLLLGEFNGVQDILYELDLEGFPNLQHLAIVNNFGMKYIIKSMEQLQPLKAFPKLESLYLYKLKNMEKICNHHLTGSSFSSLKTIKIKTCGRLSNLFSFSMVRLLTKLETIEVCDCDSLKEIVSVERQMNTISDVNDDKTEFPELRFLTLQSLPAFDCFCTCDILPSISQLYKDQVPHMDSKEGTSTDRARLFLFNEKVLFPKLECLVLSSINIQKIWSDQPMPRNFGSLLTLNVSDCGDLKYLLSFSMAASLKNLESLFVSGCEMMEDIFSMEDAGIDIFPKLKKMEITSMEKLNNIWHPNFGLNSFQSLEYVMIKECHKLVTIFPEYMKDRFQSLQTLKVIDCKSVENIFELGDSQPQLVGQNKTNLLIINLHKLPNLVHVWKDTHGSLTFDSLKEIRVRDCKNLENLFPLSVAKCLGKLESLELFLCWRIKEIVARDEGSNENTITFNFPQLTHVSLSYLPELKSFCHGTPTLEWPSLKVLELSGCDNLEAMTTETISSEVKPIFSAIEKVISNLEVMALGQTQAKWLKNDTGNIHRMHRLKSLGFHILQNTEILFQILHRIPNLESLILLNCQLKEVWSPGSLAAYEKIGTVVQLKELNLCNMSLLQNIGFEYDLLLQRVERLNIRRCQNLINLAPPSVSFIQLTYLEVRECNKLKNLMTPSTAKSLVQLETLKVIECKLILEIISENKNDEGKVEEIDFKHLKVLELVSLESLTSFSNSENCGLKFPVLEKLTVSECQRMKMFSQGVISLPNLSKVCVVGGEFEDRWYWEGDLNATIQKMLMDKVSLEYLRHLRLSEYPDLKQAWHGQVLLPENCFSNLKTLVVENCEFLKDVAIPSYVLPYLKNLEELEVRNCTGVEVIFDINDTMMKTTEGMCFHLKKMTLYQLPNLKHVWNRSPQEIVNFPNLREFFVNFCKSLKTLLPASLARNLRKLKIVDIQFCDDMVEIVGKEDATEHEPNEKCVFEFPCLSSLCLFLLPQLSCFYPDRHHLECPKLEILDVLNCDKLKLFTSEFHSHQEVLPDYQVSTNTLQKPLFLVQKVIPNLKELSLNEKNVNFLSNGQLPSDILHNLNRLCLSSDSEDANEVATLPFEFLHKVPNLEFLKVEGCNGLKQIFPSKKLQVHDGVFAQLKELSLCVLPGLNSIGLEHSWVKPHCEKLETIRIYFCFRLEKLVRHAVSFSNLKQLFVTRCHELQYLFTFSTAKSLGQLERLEVVDCNSITEIVTDGDDEFAFGEIIFGQLETLELHSLLSLESFYSGKATLQFSCLEIPRVVDCPMMKTFTGGVINAPMFLFVDASLDFTDFHLHDDLNTTTEKMFEEKVPLEVPSTDLTMHNLI